MFCKGKAVEKPKIKVAPAQEEQPYLCRFCRTPVARAEHRVRIDGLLDHVFANPHGHVFEIRCFSRAEGGVPVSFPSSEFSWFKGYEWQVGECGQCHGHLGWFYSRKEASFWGLILDNLIQP